MSNNNQNFLNKFIKTPVRGVCSFFHCLNKKQWYKTFLSGVISILIGLFLGFILMLCVDPSSCLEGLKYIIISGFTSANIINTFQKATPMILSGLAIAFAFKLNLFNIGVTGQLTVGAFNSVLAGLAGCNWFVCLLIGAISGAFMGFIPGLLKAKFNVNEVLSGIMLNWISYYTIGMMGKSLISSSFKDRTNTNYLKEMPVEGRLPSILNGTDLNVGLIIAIILVIVIWIILYKTNFGFELKMTGLNKEASRYCGVNQDKAIILSLTISGALAGIAGYMIYALPNFPSKFMWSSGGDTLLSNGFDGISVSLVGQNSPIGCLFSAILIPALDQCRNILVTISDNKYNVYYSELIKNLIIYAASLSSFFFYMIEVNNRKLDDNYYFNLRIKNNKKEIK